jgi:hypothetical protein
MAASRSLLPEPVASDTPWIRPWRLARRVPRRDGPRRHLWQESVPAAQQPAHCSHTSRSRDPTHEPQERLACNGWRSRWRRLCSCSRATGDRATDRFRNGKSLRSVFPFAGISRLSDAAGSRRRCRGPSRRGTRRASTHGRARCVSAHGTLWKVCARHRHVSQEAGTGRRVTNPHAYARQIVPARMPLNGGVPT